MLCRKDPSIQLVVGGEIVARMSKDVAELPENAHLAEGALNDVSGVFQLTSRIRDSESHAGLTESGEVVEIVAKIYRLLDAVR